MTSSPPHPSQRQNPHRPDKRMKSLPPLCPSPMSAPDVPDVVSNDGLDSVSSPRSPTSPNFNRRARTHDYVPSAYDKDDLSRQVSGQSWGGISALVLREPEHQTVQKWLGTESMTDPTLGNVIEVLEVLGEAIMSLRELPDQVSALSDAIDRRQGTFQFDSEEEPSEPKEDRKPQKALMQRAMQVREKVQRRAIDLNGATSRPHPLVGSYVGHPDGRDGRKNTAQSSSSSGSKSGSRLQVRRPSNVSQVSHKTDISQAPSVQSSAVESPVPYVRVRRPSTHSVYSDALGCVLPNLTEGRSETDKESSLLPSEASDGSEAPASPGVNTGEISVVPSMPGMVNRECSGESDRIIRNDSSADSLAPPALNIARLTSMSNTLLDAMSTTSSQGFRNHPFIISPMNPIYALWSVILCVTFVCIGFLVPILFVYTSFGTGNDDVGTTMLAFFYFADIIFILDILVTCRTAAVNEDGSLYYVPDRIRRRYAKSFLLPDLLSAWPVSITLAYFVGSSEFADDGSGRILFFQLLVAAKWLRVFKLRYIFHQLECYSGDRQFIGLKVGVFLTMALHMLACMWRAAQWAGPAVPDPLPGTQASDAIWEQYSADIYFVVAVVTTVGFGDIHPYGPPGRIYGIFCMLAGSLFFGFVLSSISQFMRKMLYDEINAQVRQARAFMLYRGIPGDLRRRVEYNLRHQLNQEREMVASKLLSNLTEGVQRDLSFELLREVLVKFPVFNKSSRAFLAEISQVFHWVNAMPGDIIVEEGQVVQELVFVVQGNLSFLEKREDPKEESKEEGDANDEQVSERRMEPGTWIGEQCLFEKEYVRTYAAVAITTAELAVLSLEVFNRVALKYPQTQELLEKMRDRYATGAMRFSSESLGSSHQLESLSEGSRARARISRVLASCRRCISGAGKPPAPPIHPRRASNASQGSINSKTVLT